MSSRRSRIKKDKKKRPPVKVSSYYEIDKEGNFKRKKQFCTRCGPGYFMAEMYDRRVCGRCGYTEFTKHLSKKSTKTGD